MIKLGNKSSFEEAEYYYELIELETENYVLLVECVNHGFILCASYFTFQSTSWDWTSNKFIAFHFRQRGVWHKYKCKAVCKCRQPSPVLRTKCPTHRNSTVRFFQAS